MKSPDDLYVSLDVSIKQLTPIEKQMDETEKYTMLIVHSLTVSDDGQPIEGRGVSPLINIEDKN